MRGFKLSSFGRSIKRFSLSAQYRESGRASSSLEPMSVDGELFKIGTTQRVVHASDPYGEAVEKIENDLRVLGLLAGQ